MRILVIASIAFLALQSAALAASKLKPEEVPEFRLRARVLSFGGQAPEGKKVSFGLAGVSGTAEGNQWCTEIKFGRPQAEATLKGYPAIYMSGWPVVLRLTVQGAADPTLVEAELTLAETGGVVKLSGELFGPSLGILVWRDDQRRPQAATMAEYNRRYWKALAGVEIPAKMRPQQFPIIDRFIGGDDDRRAWQEGIEQLQRAGFSAIMLPPSRPVRDILVKAGGRRTAWAVYNPPGYAFDFDPKVTPEAIGQWAQQQAKPYLEAGYARQDMAAFAMSDEPGWYYPSIFKSRRTSGLSIVRSCGRRPARAASSSAAT